MAVNLLFVRHGQTEDNLAHRIQGQMPGKLTKEGREQVYKIRETLKNNNIDFFLTSDLQRAIDTSIIINEALCLEINKEPLLRERNFGRITGKPYGTKVDENDLTIESMRQMYYRAAIFLKKLCDKYDEKTVLAVSHGLFLRVLQSAYLNKPLKQIAPMENTEIRHLIISTPLHLTLGNQEIEGREN